MSDALFVRRTPTRPDPQHVGLDGAPGTGTAAIPEGAEPKFPFTDEELLQRAIHDYKQSRDHFQSWRQEASECYDYVASHQWSDEDRQILADQSRPAITFNRIGPFVDGVCGLEIGNRQSTQYIPRQVASTGKSDLLTSAAQWVRDECDAEDEESESFRDVIICGVGACLSDDTLVRLPKVNFTTTRLYTGDIVEIDLENGKKLTGTPNHPVLSNVGWKRLRELEEGDYLVNASFLEVVEGFPLHQFDHVEARFEDKVNAFRAGREARRKSTSSYDFYGDGLGSKVHIVCADRELWDKIDDASCRQSFVKKLFSWWDFASGRCFDLFCNSLFGGAVLVSEGQPSLSIGHAPYSHVAGDYVVSQYVTSATQSFTHSLSVKANFLTDFFGRHLTLKIHSAQHIDTDFWLSTAFPWSCWPQCEPSSHEARLNGRMTYTDLLGDFREWKPDLEVKAREFFGANGRVSKMVTRVIGRRVSFQRDFVVHDVGTSLGMFIAGNIITSNTQTRMDYDDEPDGDIVIERVDPLELFPDPSARKQNYADGRYVMRCKDIPLAAAEAMFPDIDPLDLHAQWAEDQPDETRQPHNARLAPYYRIDQAGQIDRQRPMVRMVEYEWWEYEQAFRVLDTATGRWYRLDPMKTQIYQMRAQMLGQQPQVLKDRRKTYWKSIIGNRVLKVTKGADDGGFTYKFMTGKRDRNRGTFYGLVRAMRDPQMWANKWLSQALQIVNTNAKGGVLAETDAFVDIQEARDAWAESDSIIELNPGGLNKIQQKNPPAFPVQINQLTQWAVDAIPSVSGVNLEMIAMVQRDQPGVLEMQRKQQGMTVLSALFNAKRRYQKEQGRLMLWMITSFIADGRLIRIGGPENVQYVPLIHEQGIAEYDVIVDDAPTSPNMKERVWAGLMQMFPMLRGMALPPQAWIEFMRYSPFPASMVEKISQLAQQPQPPAPPTPLDQARIDHQQAAARHLDAKTLDIAANAGSDVSAAQADIENKRANAIAALGKVGLAQTDQQLEQAEFAVDTLLRSHDLGHSQAMQQLNLQRQDMQAQQQPEGGPQQ